MFEIQSMDPLENQVLVSTFHQVSPCCGRWFQRTHERGVSKMNLTNFDHCFFLVVMREIALGFSSGSVTCGIFVAIVLYRCVWQRMWSHRVSSQAALLEHYSLRSFLLTRQGPRSGFDFAETPSLAISPDRFDMLSWRLVANTTDGVEEYV